MAISCTSVQCSLGIAPSPLFVDHHVAGRRRYLDHQSVERLGHADLTAEPRRVGEAKGQIEHVFFVLAGRRQLNEPGLFDHDVAGRTGKRALAGTLDRNVIAMGDLEHGQAERRIDLLARSVLQYERHLRHLVQPRHSPTRRSKSLTDTPANASRIPRSMRRSAKGLESVSRASAAALISSRLSPAIAVSSRLRTPSRAPRSASDSSEPSLASAASSASNPRLASTRASTSKRWTMSSSAWSRLS